MIAMGFSRSRHMLSTFRFLMAIVGRYLAGLILHARRLGQFEWGFATALYVSAWSPERVAIAVSTCIRYSRSCCSLGLILRVDYSSSPQTGRASRSSRGRGRMRTPPRLGWCLVGAAALLGLTVSLPVRGQASSEAEKLRVDPTITLDGKPFPEIEDSPTHFAEPRRLFYVSAEAKAEGDGSQTRPWKELQAALCRWTRRRIVRLPALRRCCPIAESASPAGRDTIGSARRPSFTRRRRHPDRLPPFLAF